MGVHFDRKSTQERLDELVDFLTENHRAPARNCEDATEKSLSNWIAKARSRRRAELGEQIAAIFEDAGVDQYRGTTTVPMIERYRVFCSTRNRVPAGDSEDADEVRLAAWAVRHLTQNTPMAPRIRDFAAMATVPGPKAIAESINAKLEELERFVAATGRSPRRDAKSRVESDLAWWVAGCARPRTSTGAAVRRIYEKYRVDAQHAAAIENARLSALVGFVATTGRAPSVDSADAREAALAQWVARRSSIGGAPAARIAAIVSDTARIPVVTGRAAASKVPAAA